MHKEEVTEPAQTTDDLEQLVLQLVNSPNYHPAKPKVIAKKLKLATPERSRLRRTIKDLVRQGAIRFGAKHIVYPIHSASQERANSNELTGVFQRALAGYGFVRPAGGKRSDDIFIPLHKTLDAANGDRVRIELGRKQRDGKRSGAIVEIVDRGSRQFVGVIMSEGQNHFVQVDGTAFSEPIPVGDAGAKGARSGDKVVVELAVYPSARAPGEGVITEVLGKRGAPGVDTMSVIREYELPEVFPEAVLEEAREQARLFEDPDFSDRRDLTELPTLTIDPVDARDFDDAISLERLENGHWRLGVHIADVSHFVRRGTQLDREARDRATSVYLPDRVIPMLPELISNHLASLQPDRIRCAKSAFLEYDESGVRVDTQYCSSIIRSDRRFTYEEVDQFLGDRKAWRDKLSPAVFELLERMFELAMKLRRRRMDNGSIELTLPEIKLEFDGQGEVKGAHQVEHTESHQIIEEFMLAANEAVAELLTERELNVLRRVHESPEPRKLRQLTKFVKELGIQCESLESRHEIRRVVAEVATRPERYAVNYAVLRSMQKACYSPAEEGHYALNIKNYAHFTSPIRRYPDLIIHRMLADLERDVRPDDNIDKLRVDGDHCSQREQRAESAERDLTRIKLLGFLSKRIGKSFEAVITGVEEYGLFVQGLKLPAEGLIHVDTLGDDDFSFDRQTHTLSGRRKNSQYRLGDVVKVEVARVDLDRRELDFRMIGTIKSAPRGASKSSSRGGRRGKQESRGSSNRPRGKKKKHR
ncbi:MAG: ribonuclease R [Pirellulaceae bacterium]|nr:ribonuclease R [Pirellulaceae bacterium]